jgi:4-hydroxy-tetrahydrodipicolinate synthase
MVTPLDRAGRIDVPAVGPLVDFLLDHGVQVLFPAGSTGEGPLLTLEERKQLCEVVVDHTAGRAPVILHTGAISTAETVDLTRHAQEAGATAASIITPYFFSYSEESVYHHYLSVAQAVPDFPIFVYAFPGNAKNDVSPALLRRLRAAAPNIVGIKSSNGDLVRFQEYIQAGGDHFIPLCGVDGLMFPALMLGSHGHVSGNSNVAPELFRTLYDAVQTGDMTTARECQTRINRLRACLSDGFHLAYFKAALALRGVPVGTVRAPMRELEDAEKRTLAAGLQSFGLI